MQRYGFASAPISNGGYMSISLSNGNYPRIHDLRHTYAVHALELSISKGMDPYCSLPALSTYMGHKGIESTEYYLRLTRQYFINVLNYTQEQANTIFPEV